MVLRYCPDEPSQGKIWYCALHCAWAGLVCNCIVALETNRLTIRQTSSRRKTTICRIVAFVFRRRAGAGNLLQQICSYWSKSVARHFLSLQRYASLSGNAWLIRMQIILCYLPAYRKTIGCIVNKYYVACRMLIYI